MARRTARSSFTWRAFFEALSKVVRGERSETEHYVATFSHAFNLAKAEYRLHGRIVNL